MCLFAPSTSSLCGMQQNSRQRRPPMQSWRGSHHLFRFFSVRNALCSEVDWFCTFVRDGRMKLKSRPECSWLLYVEESSWAWSLLFNGAAVQNVSWILVLSLINFDSARRGWIFA
jgi:hypothetical protein